MSQPPHDSRAAEPLLASGALVLRGFGPGRRVALVERGGAWGLPRAVVLDGKCLVRAVREAVGQQVGVELILADFVRACSAHMAGRELVTLYWFGRAAHDLPDFEDQERLRWVPLADAPAVVDYPEERELLEQELLPGPGRLSRWLRKQAAPALQPAWQRARSAALAARLSEDIETGLRQNACLATARAASHLGGTGALELAQALFSEVELAGLTAMPPEDQALQAALTRSQLEDEGSPAADILARELRPSEAVSALSRVMQARAQLAAEERERLRHEKPLLWRHGWPALALLTAPFVLRGHALDPDLTPIHLPWFTAAWAGLAGACGTPRRVTIGRRGLALDTRQAWIGAFAGLLIWLLALAGACDRLGGPPAVMALAAIVGALLHRLSSVRGEP